MEKEKYVDESWKESAAQDKEKISSLNKEGENKDQEGTQPSEDKTQDTSGQTAEMDSIEVNFLNYVTSLGYQAMIFLGEISNPVTNKMDKNLPQAKFLIDTLSMIKDKTKGNLNEQEENILSSSVYELQMRYVEISSKKDS